jgi:hypothetical protein
MEYRLCIYEGSYISSSFPQNNLNNKEKPEIFSFIAAAPPSAKLKFLLPVWVVTERAMTTPPTPRRSFGRRLPKLENLISLTNIYPVIYPYANLPRNIDFMCRIVCVVNSTRGRYPEHWIREQFPSFTRPCPYHRTYRLTRTTRLPDYIRAS